MTVAVKQAPIDFVIAWVDGSDPAWLKQKNHYLTLQTGQPEALDVGVQRYRDWDNLKYWFRAVEKYAPWVNRVHFITWGHLPPWLDPACPKLHIVRHEDFIPEKFLPTFSSHPIELNLHRIPGLSEQFVYFNDDFFLTAPVEPEDFFVDGLPCDYPEETPMTFSAPTPINSIRVNDIIFCSKHFDRRSNRKTHWKKWFSPADPHSMLKNILMSTLNDADFFGLNIHHLPQAYRKSTLQAVWQLDPELLGETCSHRFRDERDVSQCVFKFWQLLSGNFHPYNKRKYGVIYDAGLYLDDICRQIITKSRKTICIGDTAELDFPATRDAVNHAFETVLPVRSQFEK